MFVRGGVYRVVHEALGGLLAKFSVSALMFDYVLTGPISGVTAGLYLAGLINDSAKLSGHPHLRVEPQTFAAIFAIAVTIYFWRKNVIGIHESSQKALRIMQLTTLMVVILIGWCLATMAVRVFRQCRCRRSRPFISAKARPTPLAGSGVQSGPAFRWSQFSLAWDTHCSP